MARKRKSGLQDCKRRGPPSLARVNQELVISSVRQHELREAAEKLNEQLRAEIARREQLEQALLEKDVRQRLLMDHIKDFAIFSMGTDGTIKDWNPGAEDLFGFTAPEIIGRHAKIIFTPEDRAAGIPEKEMDSAAREGFALDERWHMRKNGDRFFASGATRPLRDPTGGLLGFIKVARDITAQQQARETLRASEQSLTHELAGARSLQQTSAVLIHGGDVAALYENLLDSGIAIMGAHMASLQILDEKAAGLRLLASRGFHPKSAACWNLVAQDARVPCAAALRENKRVLIPDVETSPLLASSHDLDEYHRSGIRAVQSTPLASRSGRVIGMISTHWREPHQPGERELRLMDVLARQAADLLERTQAEQALRESRALLADHLAHLEQLVSARTAQLQETIGELEHFSYSITHDMRAPLRAMQGYAHILQASAASRLTPGDTDFLRRISQSAVRMDELIRDSLQFAKIIRERIPLSTVDPSAVFHGVMESYPDLQEPIVDIQIVGPLPLIVANEAGLAQCFSNLLHNAVKFVKPGLKPKIRVQAERKGDLVRFWFQDNGIGIPPEYHEKIFQMFQQLNKSFEGTGIGLALVRKTAERMNGKAGVESDPGKGSRFWLEFKAAPE